MKQQTASISSGVQVLSTQTVSVPWRAAGAHLTQVAHFLEQGLGVLVRHLGDAHAQRQAGAVARRRAAAGSGQARVRARAAARGRDGSGGRRLRGGRRILMLQGQLPQYRADALEYGFVGSSEAR